MARSAVSDEEVQLRKRARRRLVGAVALVIVAVAALPLLLDANPPGAPQAPQVSVASLPPESGAQPGPQWSDTAQTAAVPTDDPLVPESAAASPSLPGQPGQADESGPGADSPEAGPGRMPATQAVAPDTPSGGLENALKSSPKTVTDGKGTYVVQLIATTSPEKARDLERRLEQLKFPAYTEKTPDGAKTRVRVGPFARQEAAESARQRLLQLGFDPGKVARRGE
ncbi:MAG: SPOR domain-containing protein [Burkholderiales bacterium]|nr:SPOR domain-containing protein [Burkholderiales bacterium]